MYRGPCVINSYEQLICRTPTNGCVCRLNIHMKMITCKRSQGYTRLYTRLYIVQEYARLYIVKIVFYCYLERENYRVLKSHVNNISYFEISVSHILTTALQ